MNKSISCHRMYVVRVRMLWIYVGPCEFFFDFLITLFFLINWERSVLFIFSPHPLPKINDF